MGVPFRRCHATDKVDVLVIGTGTAGYTLALACRKAGRQVAVVDNRPYGGTCAMRGCEPEKYLVEAAQVARLSQQMSEIGIHPAAHIDWPALMRSKSAFTSAVPERTETALQKAGVEIFLRQRPFRFARRGRYRRGDQGPRPGRGDSNGRQAWRALEFPGAEL